jgi:hypothetical protein
VAGAAGADRQRHWYWHWHTGTYAGIGTDIGTCTGTGAGTGTGKGGHGADWPDVKGWGGRSLLVARDAGLQHGRFLCDAIGGAVFGVAAVCDSAPWDDVPCHRRWSGVDGHVAVWAGAALALAQHVPLL